jgi:hypothetical protein
MFGIIRAVGNLGKIGKAGKAAAATRGAAAGTARGAARGGGIGRTLLGAGSSFLGGLFSGATGGSLGGNSRNNAGNGGTARLAGSGSSFFGISNASSTKINGPSLKDDCCAHSIALLTSIDETLKRSLYISQRLATQNSEMLAEGGNQKIAGLGGTAEALADSSEKMGFGLGKMILETAGLFILSNAGKLLDLGKDAFDSASSIVDGIAKTIDDVAKSPLISPVVEGIDTLFKGNYQAKTEEGQVAGVGGSILGGVLGGVGGGMMAGAIGGSAAGPVGTLVGAIGMGILGGIVGEDAFEALGDVFAKSFNENVDAEKIGKETGDSFLNRTRNKIDFFMSSVAPDYKPGGMTASPKSLGDLVAKYESGGDANIYNRYDPSSKQYVAVRGKELSSMSVNDIMKEQSMKSDGKSTNMFAVGKYQYTPETLKDIIDRMKKQKLISGNERFTGDLQDQIFNFSIMNDKKFENLRKYLSGDTSAKKPAMLELAKEWRSLPDPNTGKTYGDKGSRFNRSQISLEDFSNILDKMQPPSNATNINPIITPKTVTGEIDRAALIEKYKVPMAAPNTIVMNQPAPVAKNNNMPAVPYPVDGPRLPLVTSQFIPKNLYGMGM